jgi:hypothetical protein
LLLQDHGPAKRLIRHGALGWQADRRGKTALDYARKGSAGDRERIAELLDRRHRHAACDPGHPRAL